VKHIDKQLDIAFSRYIRLKYPHCVLCGRGPTQCAHIFQGRSESTKWHEDCAYGLCVHCHTKEHAQDGKPFESFARSLLGDDRYYELVRLNNAVSKTPLDEKRALLDAMRDFLKDEA